MVLFSIAAQFESIGMVSSTATVGTGMPASQEWNVTQTLSVNAKPQKLIEAEIDGAIKSIKRASHRAEVDSIVQALVRTSGAAEM